MGAVSSSPGQPTGEKATICRHLFQQGAEKPIQEVFVDGCQSGLAQT